MYPAPLLAVEPMDILVGTIDIAFGDLRGIDAKVFKLFVFCFGVAVIAISIVINEPAALAILDKFVQF